MKKIKILENCNEGGEDMTLDEAKVLLTENDIDFELVEYKDEEEYWHHTTLYPYTKNAKPCKVLAMVVKSNNGGRDIELQFNEEHGLFYFVELRFGSFSFEIFDDGQEGELTEKLIVHIREIQEGNYVVIVANNIEKHFGLWDSCFEVNDTEDEFYGKRAFEEEMHRIQGLGNASKGWFEKFLEKLLRTKIQYEIYDWNTYECIVKEC